MGNLAAVLIAMAMVMAHFADATRVGPGEELTWRRGNRPQEACR